tara:strand:- start:1494 stop:2588 length:1095 start_codon:yes stop_codon:yes gene_type:complete
VKVFNLPTSSKVGTSRWQDLSDEELGGSRENTACLVRYGGYGDQLQISSIFPLLKDQGYNVCVNVTETGATILRNDPNVDELFIQKTNQVPNDELGLYWDRLKPLFSKFTNLGHVIEHNLLCVPQQPIYNWDTGKRHKKLNKNYGEALHDAAEVEHSFCNKFFRTHSERKWVARQKRDMRIGLHHYVIMIALSGSSVHKAYPHLDAVMARVLIEWPNVRIVMVGDEVCRILERGWEKEGRVFRRSGTWEIRKTLAFAQQCDLILGPETGVLNAVSSDDVAKVCLLSHSSEENLTKHWVNATAIYPEGVHCYPCHKMHWGFNHCNRDVKTGGAMCAAKIDPETVFNAIEYHRNMKYDVLRTLSNS